MNAFKLHLKWGLIHDVGSRVSWSVAEWRQAVPCIFGGAFISCLHLVGYVIFMFRTNRSITVVP